MMCEKKASLYVAKLIFLLAIFIRKALIVAKNEGNLRRGIFMTSNGRKETQMGLGM
jgi:hypothetical protein